MNSPAPAPSTTVNRVMEASPTSSIMDSCFLQSTPCLYSHVYELRTRKDEYLRALGVLCEKGLLASSSQAIKARIVAALHLTRQHDTLQNTVLPHCEVVELVKALSLLDRPRRLRQLQRKMKEIEALHPHVLVEFEKRCERREQRRRLGRGLPIDPPAPELVGEADESQASPERYGRGLGWLRLRRQLKQIESSNDDQFHRAIRCHEAHTDPEVHELIESSSVSGSLARKIRTWARTQLTSDFLEFVILTMPTENWKRLSDMVHFHPDDFALPYFLSFVHRGIAALPEGSFIKEMREFFEAPWEERPARFFTLSGRHPQLYLSYAFLRTQPQVLNGHTSIREDLAQRIPLDTAVWYLEELDSQSHNLVVPDIVASRLEREKSLGNSKVATLGKLMERILTFQSRGWYRLAKALMPIAELRLQALKNEWSTVAQVASCSASPTTTGSPARKWNAATRALTPIAHLQLPALEKERLATQEELCTTVVFGDASGSMTTAIQAATILASMISVCWNGELSFFKGQSVASPHPRPVTVAQILEVCSMVRATGTTSIASALWPYYEAKRRLERIVLVTDEKENTPCGGYMFARLLQVYRKEVHAPVELILVGVGPGLSQFRPSLTECGITYKRIEIDMFRPDLSKFDALLGQMALASTHGETGVAMG